MAQYTKRRDDETRMAERVDNLAKEPLFRQLHKHLRYKIVSNVVAVECVSQSSPETVHAPFEGSTEHLLPHGE